MKADPKHLLPLILSVALTGQTTAGDARDLIEKLRTVIPAGWEVGQEAGTSIVTVTRQAAIPPADLTIEHIPCSPVSGEGSEYHAKLHGIRVWFALEPVGACSAAEYLQRKACNAGIEAQLEPLRKQIEQIPVTPSAKPSLLSRTPRNAQEKSWLAEFANVSSKLRILPTHHFAGTGFLLSLAKSHYGARITTTAVTDEIKSVRKAVETVLIPYESPAKPPDAETKNEPKQQGPSPPLRYEDWNKDGDPDVRWKRDTALSIRWNGAWVDVEHSLLRKDGIERDPNDRPFVISPDNKFRYTWLHNRWERSNMRQTDP